VNFMSSTLRVGIFVVGGLLVFATGVFLIGSRDFRFTRTYRLNSEFKSVAGLDNGATVRVGGIHEGTVRTIVLPQKPDQKIRVEMDLHPSTRNVIKKDSLASIRTGLDRIETSSSSTSSSNGGHWGREEDDD